MLESWKKLSTMSAVSNGSLATRELGRSKGGILNLSRGEVLRHLGEKKSSYVTEACDTEEVDIATFMKESVLGAKARAAADMMGSMGDPHKETDILIATLAALTNSVVTGTDDLILAGYAEACVSVLLMHLSRAGVDKTCPEEVVTSQLLLEVNTVATLFRADPKLRVTQQGTGTIENCGTLATGQPGQAAALRGQHAGAPQADLPPWGQHCHDRVPLHSAHRLLGRQAT